MNHIEHDIPDTIDQIQPDNHLSAEIGPEDIAALFARLKPQDVERFYQHYQHWNTQARIQTLTAQIAELQQAIAHNAELLDQYHPSSTALSILAQFQEHGVNDVDLLDRMLERGDDWLDHTMQLLEQCEHLDIIHGNYTEWCEHALEGAYDWIASMHEDDDSSATPTADVFDESTEQLFLQKLLSEAEEEPEPEIVEQLDNNILAEETVSSTSREAASSTDIFPVETAISEKELVVEVEDTDTASEAAPAPLSEAHEQVTEISNPSSEEEEQVIDVPADTEEDEQPAEAPVGDVSSTEPISESAMTIPDEKEQEESAIDSTTASSDIPDDIEAPDTTKAQEDELDEPTEQPLSAADVTIVSTTEITPDAESIEAGSIDSTETHESADASLSAETTESITEEMQSSSTDIATDDTEHTSTSIDNLDTSIMPENIETEVITDETETIEEPENQQNTTQQNISITPSQEDISEEETKPAVAASSIEATDENIVSESADQPVENRENTSAEYSTEESQQGISTEDLTELESLDSSEEEPLSEIANDTEDIPEITAEAMPPAASLAAETAPATELVGAVQHDETVVEPSAIQEQDNIPSLQERPSHGEITDENPTIDEEITTKNDAGSDEDTIAIPKLPFFTARVIPQPALTIATVETQPALPTIAPETAPATTRDDTIVEATTIADLPAIEPQTPAAEQEQAIPIRAYIAESNTADTDKQATGHHIPRLIWHEPGEYPMNQRGAGYAGQALLPQTPPPPLPEVRYGFFRRLWLKFLAWLKG